jgi:hypothetical protein
MSDLADLREAFRRWDKHPGLIRVADEDEIRIAARQLLSATEIRWCETHGDWAPSWYDGETPIKLCRWAHHVLHDKPEKPCSIIPGRLILEDQ